MITADEVLRDAVRIARRHLDDMVRLHGADSHLAQVAAAALADREHELALLESGACG